MSRANLEEGWERALPSDRMTFDVRLRALRDRWDEDTYTEQRGAGEPRFDARVTKADLVDLLDVLIVRAAR